MTFREKIENGKFVVCAEMGPPRSSNGDVLRKKAAHFRNGVDAVNITDNQTAIVRLSSIAAAKILIDEGLEPIIKVTCRDRNRIAIQSDLLGAAALGIENVLCLTGDHQRFGDHTEAKGVFDLDSILLTATAHQLTEGKLLSGFEMKQAPKLFVGAGANPFAEPFVMRIIRLDKKIRAGAKFIQTQPVFDLARFNKWMDAARKGGLHEKTAIIAGVMPVKSAKALQYMQKEVPGVRIDEDYIRRMSLAEDPQEEGVKMAVEIINEVRKIDGIRGVHLMPVMWEKITPRIVEEANLA